MPWDFETFKEYVDQGNLSRDDAIRVALATLDRRLEGMNEFRKSLSDLSNRFVTIDMYDSEHKALEAKMEAYTERIGEVEQAQARAQGAVIGKMNQLLIAVIVAAVSVSLTFVWAHATLPTPVGK